MDQGLNGNLGLPEDPLNLIPAHVPVTHDEVPPLRNGDDHGVAPPTPTAAANTELDKIIQALQYLTTSQQNLQQNVQKQI